MAVELGVRKPLPRDLGEVRDMIDDVWGSVYDQAVAEVRTKGRYKPSWAANARYMQLLRQEASLQGNLARVRELGDTLEGLREREGYRVNGFERRTEQSESDLLFGFGFIRHLDQLSRNIKE